MHAYVGERNGNPFQCSCLENPRDGGARWAAIYGVAQSQIQLKWLSSSSSNLLYGPTLTSVHDYWKQRSFDYTDVCQQSDVSVFNTLSRFVIAFHPRSKCLLILWLQSLSMVILEPKKINSVTVFKFSLSICHEAMWPDTMIFIFWMLSFKPTFSLYPDMDSQYFSLLSG